MTIVLSTSELNSLLIPSEGIHISLFMPTYRTGRETRQNRIRLKNLLRNAEKGLLELGQRVSDAQALLEPAEKLLGPTDFWMYPGDGLAIFLAPGRAHLYPLPLRLKKKLVIADRFQVKPLLPLFSDDGSFFVLALSQNEVRLLQGTRYSISQVELETGSQSLSDILIDSDPEQHLDIYVPSGAPGAPGRQAAVFHGIGGGKDTHQAKLQDYLRQIDRALQPIFREQKAPLILAGVEQIQALFREVSVYPHIFEIGIFGNPEQISAGELHAEAWRMVHPYFQKARRAAKNRYRMLSGQGSPLASDRVETILPAALHGQVELLFVALGVQRWGEFDPASALVVLHETYQPGYEDLLDRAAVLTLLNRGEVFTLRPDQIPGRTPAAAVLRY